MVEKGMIPKDCFDELKEKFEKDKNKDGKAFIDAKSGEVIYINKPSQGLIFATRAKANNPHEKYDKTRNKLLKKLHGNSSIQYTIAQMEELKINVNE